MPASDVVDLCSGDSDSDSDLPPLASLTARLQQRRAGATSAAATAAALTAATATAPRAAQPNGAARAPLLAVHNQVAGSLPGKQQADNAELESPPRPQYHQQEQWREQQQQQHHRERATPSSVPPSGPRRGKRAPPDADASLPLASQQLLPLGFEDDEEWRPGDSPASQPAGKKQRRAKRTKEEIEADKALKEQQREEQRRAKAAAAAARETAKAAEKEERKAVKQAQSKTHALKQVRLLVDSSLVSAGSLGVGLLAQLDEHNSRNAAGDKRICYAVAPLDLAPYRALRWQRRRLVAGLGTDGQPAPPGSQQGLGGTQASGSGRLEEQWEDEPHVMVPFQPQELIDAVRADRLAALFSLLDRRAPGQRAHLLVVGLAAHIAGTERRQHQADMRAGAQAPRQQSARLLMEQFVASLAVECPRLGFRDVVDAAQAAQHVQLLTVAIANLHHRETDATVFLRTHDRSDRTSVTNLLIGNPLEDRSLEPCLRSLATVPAVKPGIAHALATNYGSLGGLMDMLLDPGRSDREKEQEIAGLRNVGTATARRVGPAAARQLLQLLRSADPDLRIREAKEGEAADQA